MRQRKNLIKNKKFYKMCRSEFKVHLDKGIGFKKWLIKYWNDLVEAFDILIE